jgi:hypothetical protein
MTRGNKRVMRDILMATGMKVISNQEKLMAKVYTIGPMERSTMVNGQEELRTDMACGGVSLEIATWDSGMKVKLMVMEYISGKMETDMKDHGQTVSSMGKAQIFSRTVTSTLATM